MSAKKAKRHATKEKANIEVYGHRGILQASLKNLSGTGAFLEVAQGDYIPQKGDLVNVTVNLDRINRTHNVDAQVIWCKGMGLGVCFISKDEVLERMMAKTNAI
ncbi:PilZ domain protein [compost metagenome]